MRTASGEARDLANFDGTALPQHREDLDSITISTTVSDASIRLGASSGQLDEFGDVSEEFQPHRQRLHGEVCSFHRTLPQLGDLTTRASTGVECWLLRPI